MSIWGSGPFENDDAADWTTRLSKNHQLAQVEAALLEISHPAHARYLDIDICCNAVAAAEIFTRVLRRDHDSGVLSEEVWKALGTELKLLSQPEVNQVVIHAIGAIDRILNDSDDSELLQLRQESPTTFAAWAAYMEKLLNRLRAAKSGYI